MESPTFEGFLKVRMREFRGLEGERRLAFVVGQDELMIVAPEGVTEPGIDLITYKGGRIKLRDNKAIADGRTVGTVSALEWNLPKNLKDATAVFRDSVAKGGSELPPEFAKEVLPRMEAASKEISEWVNDHPNADLKSIGVQKEFAKILGKYGIDRIVDLEGAGSAAGVSGKLLDRGFEGGVK